MAIRSKAPVHSQVPVSVRAYLRSIIALTLFVVWGLAAFSGILLWLAPIGPRSGQIVLLLGLTKSGWGDIHFWTSVIALGVTAVHVTVDWRALHGCMRYLASPHRELHHTERSPGEAVLQ